MKLVPVWWNEMPNKNSSVLMFTAKIRHYRKRIKEWCASNFYSIEKTKREVTEEIQKLDILEECQSLTRQQQENRK